MTVAFDAASASASVTTDPFSWTHTPAGTPKGVIVWVVGVAVGDQIASVTYGALTLTQATGSPVLTGAGESINCHAFYGLASIPTGAQTVTVDKTTGTNPYVGMCITVTAVADTQIDDTDATINSTAVADPSVTLSTGGLTCLAAIGFGSGQDAVTGITPLSGWTSRAEVDFGSLTCGCYTYDTIASSDVTAGWTQTSEDAAAIAFLISDTDAGGGGEVLVDIIGMGLIPFPR